MAIMTRLTIVAVAAFAFASNAAAQSLDPQGFIEVTAAAGFCSQFKPACKSICASQYPTKKPVQALCRKAKKKPGKFSELASRLLFWQEL